MLETLRTIFDSRSSMERLVDKEPNPESAPLASKGILDRRAIPTLSVTFHPKKDNGILLQDIRVATACIEFRLKKKHPHLTDFLETYRWTSSKYGPNSKHFNRDIPLMASTDRHSSAPIGVSKCWTFGGNFKPNFYAIEATSRALDGFFNRASIQQTTVEAIVEKFYTDHKCSHGLNYFDAKAEADNLLVEFNGGTR
jgi:hypothetical protein